MKKSFEVSILNQKFIIKSDADERYVQKVSDYINKKIHDITSHTKSVSTLRVAILAALNVADDFFKLREKRKDVGQVAEKKIRDILSVIDAQLSEEKKTDLGQKSG